MPVYKISSNLLADAVINFNPAVESIVKLSPIGNHTLNALGLVKGQALKVILYVPKIVTSTITFGTNFNATGNLTVLAQANKEYIVEFLCDGTAYNEVSRVISNI